MRRIIEPFFEEWKNRTNRKPLIVRGARQVGKTYSIETYAKRSFKAYLKINFEENLHLKSLFKTNNIKNIINELSILFNIEILPGEFLLFLDEIQACPEAIISLRYFYEQYPELHVIAAGSLLDHTLKEVNLSMPVGRVEFCYMYPINFKEFLWALSQDKIVKYIEDFSFKEGYSEPVHNKIMEFFRNYLFIGGMPEAVKTYLENEKLNEVERIHSSIMTALKYDFGKYGTKKQQEHLSEVFQYSALNIGKKVKYTNINKDTRSIILKESFIKLELSRLVHLVRHTNASGVPLTKYQSDTVFKPVFLDIGLSNYLSGIKLIELVNLYILNEGMLAEQFIGQELLCLADIYRDQKLVYWTREEKNSNAEIDYIYQFGNQIYPVEVKSGKSGSLKSLHMYLFEKKLKTGIRFNLDLPSIGNFTVKVVSGGEKDELYYTLVSLPIYMCFNLPRIISQLKETSQIL